MNDDARASEDELPILDPATMDVDEIMRLFGMDRFQAWELHTAATGGDPSDMEIVDDDDDARPGA